MPQLKMIPPSNAMQPPEWFLKSRLGWKIGIYSLEDRRVVTFERMTISPTKKGWKVYRQTLEEFEEANVETRNYKIVLFPATV